MPQVKVTVPATATNIGPGLHVVGLALSMHASVEIRARDDGRLSLTMRGDGQDALPLDYTNPIMKPISRVFQRFEKAPAGMDIHIENDIPWEVGLGAEAALTIGALLAANNIIEGDLQREDIIKMAYDLGIPAPNVTAALFGALTVCSEPEANKVFYKNLDVVPLKVVVAVPYVPDYQSGQINLPTLVALEEAIFNIGQTALMIEALRTGDFDLLAHSMGDKLHQPNYISAIPEFETAQEAALESGAIALIVSGNGPALLAVAEDLHEPIANALVEVYAEKEIAIDTYIVGIDRQGITLSITD